MLDKKKYFLWGIVSGIFGLPTILIITGVALYFYFENDITSYIQEQADQTIQEPNVPSEEPADYNWKVIDTNFNGVGMIDVGTLRGKTVFVNVWATWCIPCIVEMKYIENLYKIVKDDVVFLVVSEETPIIVQNFAKDKDYSFPMYSVVNGKLPKTFKMPGIPSTFVISPSGNIVFKHMGSAKWDSAKFIRFLNSVSTIY